MVNKEVEHIVVVGPHRSGKTTLCNLLRDHFINQGYRVFVRSPLYNYDHHAPGFETDMIIHDGVTPLNPNTNYKVIATSYSPAKYDR